MKRICTLFCLLLIAAGPMNAQWSIDPFINNPISTATSVQSFPVMISDGAGGAIITWRDSRNGATDLFAQRIDAAGVPQWTADGVAISTAANEQTFPCMVSDGAGGAIIAWADSRGGANYDIYAQRINGAGGVQWAANGVAISIAAANQIYPAILSDGSGGAIITWQDARSGNIDIYAQRIDGDGVAQWTLNGVVITTAAGDQYAPAIASDGSGGAIITWYDYRNGSNFDIYAQRVIGSGLVQWTANGVAICLASDAQLSPTIVGDGSGGAIITWYDHRNGTNDDIFAQHINSAGVVQWGVNGYLICGAANYQQYPFIVSDGSGGAIITWTDSRSGAYNDIYAQRINGSGNVLWTSDGVGICVAAYHQSTPCIIGDGSGGATIAWTDQRILGTSDVYAQRVNYAGLAQWTANGVAISTATGDQTNSALISDGAGGAIMAWQDYRGGLSYDIYAQKVDKFGYFATNTPRLTDVKDVAADQGGKVTVAWDRADLDAYPAQTITYYSLWRGIDLSAIPPQARFVEPQELSEGFQGNVYRRVINAGVTTNWELVGTQTSHYLSSYSFSAPTLADSTSGGTGSLTYFVSAHTSNQFIFWDSNVDSGYSVDNLSPASVAPVSATVQAGPTVSIHWKPDGIDSDVGHYEVHRSTTSGFTPGPSTKIGTTSDTLLVDGAPVNGQTNYYRIVTVDVHGNMSGPSPQAAAMLTTTQDYDISDKWNMVSVPLSVVDYSKTTLFPTAVSNAFAYEGGYSIKSTLANNAGYWVKFSGAQSVPMTGYLRNLDTVIVSTGWNMIGSLSSSVATSSISSEPAGIVTSQFFGYTGSYVTSAAIDPGKAYWVKVQQDGKLILASSAAEPAARINIVPTSELPPSPPDAEAAANTSIIPTEFSLGQNYPNPFNPATTIEFDVAKPALVSLKIYDVLGREAATLVNERLEPGRYTRSWDATHVESGLYFYKFTTESFTSTKKLLLVK